MSNKIIKPLTFAIGAAFIGSLSLSQVAQASSGFQLNQMKAGYMLADQAAPAAGAPAAKGKDGKCGEGKCGATKGKKCMEMTDKAAQDKCMADAHPKGKEGSCSADKKGKEGSCSADKKGKEGSCSADKKGKEGSCSADKKGKEGSCSGGHG
jgi:uncharacterized low-complexity protein